MFDFFSHHMSYSTALFILFAYLFLKVLLVSHFPPGASENAPQWYQFLRPEINDQFVNILIDNADLLMTGLFAHEHVDSFRLLVSKSS